MTDRVKLLLFDRDGTLNYERRDYHHDPEALRTYPFAGPALTRLSHLGYKLGVVTNQSGIARGYWSAKSVERLHESMCREWSIEMRLYYCPHHPDDGCSCRKPAPGLLHDAMSDHSVEPHETWFIGDSLTDLRAAEAVGMTFGLVLTGRGPKTLQNLDSEPLMLLDTISSLVKFLSDEK